IQATMTSPIAWKQSDLFDRHQALHREAIAKLIDNLSSRMGRTAVVAPSVHRDPQPELAYSWRALTGWRKDGTVQETKRKLSKAPRRNFAEQRSLEPSIHECWRRPMRLLSSPKSIEVVMNDPLVVPSIVDYQGIRMQVTMATGPERIDSGWWQGATQQRDYYRLELANGSWIWVYLDRRERTWYLHGEFD
ncbi:MAG: hypothetical protein ABL921_24775, partial [Pirellula sp.]